MLRSELAEKAEKAIAAGEADVALNVMRKRKPPADCAIVPGLRARCIDYDGLRDHATLAVDAHALKHWCDTSDEKGIWTFSVAAPPTEQDDGN